MYTLCNMMFLLCCSFTFGQYLHDMVELSGLVQHKISCATSSFFFFLRRQLSNTEIVHKRDLKPDYATKMSQRSLGTEWSYVNSTNNTTISNIFFSQKKKQDDFFLRKLGVWRQFCINLPEIYNNMKRLIENNNSLIVFHECIRSVCMNHHSRAATCSYLLSSSWARSLHFASIRQNLVFGFGDYIFFFAYSITTGLCDWR